MIGSGDDMNLEGDVLVLVGIWARECGVEVMCVCVYLCFLLFFLLLLPVVAWAGWVGDMRA